MRFFTIPLVCLATATLIPAQSDPKSKIVRVEAERPSGFILDVGEHELRDIIEKAARFLGRNYIFYPEEEAVQARGRRGAPAQGLHTIQLQKKLILDALACEEVISQLAYSRGFVIVPVDALRGIYELVSVRGSRANEVWNRITYLSPTEVLRKSRQRVLVGTVIPLKHISASRASQQLRPFFSSSGLGGIQLGTVGSESKLMVRGFADQVAGAIRLLEKADVPGEKSGPGLENVGGQLSYLTQRAMKQDQRIKTLESQIAQLQRLIGKLQVQGKDGEAGDRQVSPRKEGSRPASKR